MSTKAVWVINLNYLDRKPTFLVSEDEPVSPNYTDISSRPIPSDPIFETYTDLCTYLIACGFTPPPETYFSPTDFERDQRRTPIIRRVPECEA